MLPRFLTFTLKLVAGICCAFLLAGAHAGSFQIDPVRVELAPNRLSATLVVHNDGSDPAVIRIEARSWRQSNGEDLFESTKEVLVTPPIITIAPGAEQIVRVALRQPIDPQRELSYRIFLQEVPPPPRPGFSGLQVALRISIPVFAKPGPAAKPNVGWKASYDAKARALRLNASNEGNAHLQIQEFKFLQPDSDTVVARHSVASYLLPGQGREWNIKLDPTVHPGRVLRLKAATDAGDLDQEISIDAP